MLYELEFIYDDGRRDVIRRNLPTRELHLVDLLNLGEIPRGTVTVNIREIGAVDASVIQWPDIELDGLRHAANPTAARRQSRP